MSLTVGDAAARQAPEHVLTRTGDRGPEGRLPADRGAALLHHQLRKLTTTASVLYTAGHPDDEEAGVLTFLSRGMGVRTALLTLNRGEGGANAIGPELFDALGLIRSEELRLAGRYYGLDDQYFTTAVDYGYSKTLGEALRSWDREAVLGDMVRIIRRNRPLVVVSRWHGSERDGHGHHQAAGVLTPDAVRAAGDPERFPEQITDEGLQPWRVLRLYRGRLQAGEAHDAEVDPYAHSTWLGESYQDFGSYGLSLQRSQTAGRRRTNRGPQTPARYELLEGPRPAGGPDSGIFDGLGSSLAGAPTLVGEEAGSTLSAHLVATDSAIHAALIAFDPTQPSAVIPDLGRAMTSLRSAREAARALPETDFLLAIKERQLADALTTAAGLTVTAHATPRGASAGTPMGPAVPGQSLDVHTYVTSVADDARLLDIEVSSRAGWVSTTWGDHEAVPIADGVTALLGLDIPSDAEPTRPWFHRPDIRFNQYLVRDSAEIHLGEARSRADVTATVEVAGIRFAVSAPVRTFESDAPRGMLERPLEVAPQVSLRVAPRVAIRPGAGPFTLRVDVTSNTPTPIAATVSLEAPAGWSAVAADRDVSSSTLDFRGAGETLTATFRVTVPGNRPTAAGPFRIGVTATVDGRIYREGYQTIAHRDLRTRRLYEPAQADVHVMDTGLPPDLRIGYVMGVGDDVPSAIEQLGGDVTLLDTSALSGGVLDDFDAIVVGTRAYAVRADLVANNNRLLAYARNGGNLVVLYQTPEYEPATQAPFPAALPGNAEETSEEDAPIVLLAADHPLLTTPNRLTDDSWADWVEQRGSKFFSEWSDAYTPLIETNDTGQSPQRGIWVTAPTGRGHFTYIALALHRQLPYGVPGAYRILANLLALGL